MIGIIFNPHTNKGASVDTMAEIRRVLDEKKVEYVYRESNAPRDCVHIAQELSETCDTLVACGGDGTLFEVVTGAHEKDVTFCLFPVGSGNDVSRSIGSYNMTPEQMVDMLIAGKTRDFDYSIVNEKYCSTLFVSYGVVTNVTAKFAAMPKSSRFGYGKALISAILTHKVRGFTLITEDGKSERVRVDMISLQNVRTGGGGLTMCDEAIDNDGYVDLVMVHRKNRGRLLLNIIALARGKLCRQPNVEIRKVKYAEIHPDVPEVCAIDGELVLEDRVYVREAEKPLRMIYPEKKE